MTNSKPTAHRKFFLRFGLVLLTFTLLCLLLAAFAPPPNPATAALGKTPSATVGPTPTRTDPGFCGGFKAKVTFLGFDDQGNPQLIIDIRDVRDHDCDGIPDNDDNCDYTPNTDQNKSDPNATYGDACVPESGYRLTNRASEVVVYQMSNGSLHLYSPEGNKLGELSRAGVVQIDPTLVVRQKMGRTYIIGYTNAAGQFRSTQFQSNALTFGLSDIAQVLVFPPVAEVKVGQSVQLFAKGFHASGLELWFMPRWSATGGTVNNQGVYTAGSVPGEYTATACRIASLCGSATIRVVP